MEVMNYELCRRRREEARNLNRRRLSCFVLCNSIRFFFFLFFSVIQIGFLYIFDLICNFSYK